MQREALGFQSHPFIPFPPYFSPNSSLGHQIQLHGKTNGMVPQFHAGALGRFSGRANLVPFPVFLWQVEETGNCWEFGLLRQLLGWQIWGDTPSSSLVNAKPKAGCLLLDVIFSSFNNSMIPQEPRAGL